MNDLIALAFTDLPVRMVMIDGVPWWVGVDVTKILELKKPYQALDALEEYERGTYIIGTPSGEQTMIVINEAASTV